MQVISSMLEETLEQDVSLGMYSRVIAEWEINAFRETTVTGSPSTDEDLFPMASVAEPRRPVRKGIPKARVNYAYAVDPGVMPKYRTPSEDDTYKYYVSEAVTWGGTNFNPEVQLSLVYDEPAPCNKIVLGFETSWSGPTNASAFITYDGDEWEFAGSFPVDADGLIQLWLQENGSWGQTQMLYEDNYTEILGVRVVVNNMQHYEVPVAIIQVSPRFSVDLTNRTIDASVSRQREYYDITNPVGTAGAATAEIQFANDDRFFDHENTGTVLKGFIDRNVLMDVSTVVRRRDGNSEAVHQGTFYVDEWSVDAEGTAGATCTDRSKFMQEAIVEQSFYWNMTAEYIVADILQKFGHPLYDIRYTAADAERTIPYVFFKNEETVWDALMSLSLAEQSSFYFDESDRFVWESRDYVWQSSTPDWRLRNDTFQELLPNIISWNPMFEVGANKVNIKYTPLKPVTGPNGEALNNVVWELSDGTTTNASPLTVGISYYGPYIYIDPEDYRFWPEEGILNVDGEFMRYRNAGDGPTPRLEVYDRGLYNSPRSFHSINPQDNNWRFRLARHSSTNMQKIWENSDLGNHRVRNSYVELSTPGTGSSWNTAHYFVGELGNSYAYYGCELVFPASIDGFGGPYYDGEGIAGLMLNHDGDWNGYHFELLTTQFATAGDSQKAEVRAWRRNGGRIRFLGESSEETVDLYPEQGRIFDIFPGSRHRLEVLYRRIDGENHFNVFVDGRSTMSFVDDLPSTKRTSGYWGVFCRGKTNVRFDAAWAMNSPEQAGDEVLALYPSLRDRITGGFNSGLLESSWSKMNRPHADIIFEDFGPIVHGGMEFNVDYEIAPNVASDLFVSNDADHFVVMHEPGTFTSKFAIVNKSREDAVLVGSDPSRDNQNMSLFVYGRPIIAEDERTISREDIPGRRRRGLEELELESPWIQTKARAERIADWFIERWGDANDIVEVETVIIPHIQLGDLVDIDMPSENLYPTSHQYNVIGFTKAVGSQHTMSLTLRRRR